MTKYVSIQRIHQSIMGLPKWRGQVNSQGAQHLWIFLSLKYKGVTTDTTTPFEEADDKAFFDSYMRVQNTEKPYYDPVASNFRIATHPHSNVSTARKKTFVLKWQAAEATEGPDGQEMGRLLDGYLPTLEKQVLTKARTITRVPLFDLIAWLYRTTPLADADTLDDLMNRFRADFHITPNEFSTLFGEVDAAAIKAEGSNFFSPYQASDQVILLAAQKKGGFQPPQAPTSLQVAGTGGPVRLDDVLQLVRYGRRQLVLQGPPGTGKTFMARQLAARLMGADVQTVSDPAKLAEFLAVRQFSCQPTAPHLDQAVRQNGGTWDIVQFHPSYTYEDFVRGIAATAPVAGGFPAFEVEDRIMGTLAQLSIRVQDVPIVLIVDEINRGDLSKVLGELVFALEYRGEAVRTPYSVQGSTLLSIGSSFYLLATMNTADRSIALVDYAIRRRFDFVELRPYPEFLRDYLDGQGLRAAAGRVMDLFNAVSALFQYQQDFAVGHTYFMGKDTEDVARRFVFQALPLLLEYQKEGILDENATISLAGAQPGTGILIHLRHDKPFALAAKIKTWLDTGNVPGGVP